MQWLLVNLPCRLLARDVKNPVIPMLYLLSKAKNAKQSDRHHSSSNKESTFVLHRTRNFALHTIRTPTCEGWTNSRRNSPPLWWRNRSWRGYNSHYPPPPPPPASHLLGSGKECIELQTFTGGAAGLAWHTTTGAPPGSAVWCLLMQRERATFTGSSSSSINLLYFRYTQSFILPAFFEQFQSARIAC